MNKVARSDERVKGAYLLADFWRRAGLPADLPPSAGSVKFDFLTDDSRQVRPGAVFVAVRGEKSDGHDFVTAAARAGASAIVVEREVAGPEGVPVIRVADSREALAHLAGAFWEVGRGEKNPLPVIAVTGTNGKTSTTWMLRSILEHAGLNAALLGTVEYDLIKERRPASLTTPGSIELCRSLRAARDAGANYAVIETSSHALDQRRCDGLHYVAGVFTNLTGEHLDYHKTMEAYLAAKRRLFQLLGPQTVAVINADDPSAEKMVEGTAARVVRYGLFTGHLDVQGFPDSCDRRGQRCRVRFGDAVISMQLALVGRHNLLNALAAAATADALGVDRSAVVAGLERLTRIPGRLQRVEPDGCPFSVFVDYAHTDDALENVLQAVRPFTAGRIICVFGCGGDRDRAKRPRMGAVVGRLAQMAFVTSDNPRTEEPESIIDEIMPGFGAGSKCLVHRQADRRMAIYDALAEARAGDTVVIAGKGHENYQLMDGQTFPFDDVEVARSFLHAPATGEEVA